MQTKESQTAFPFEREKSIHTLYVKSMRESALVMKITLVKANKMLMLNGMSIKMQKKKKKDPETTKHLFQRPDHVFLWKSLMSAPINNPK